MLSSNTRTEGVATAGGGLAHGGQHRADGGYHGHADGRPANRGLADGAMMDMVVLMMHIMIHGYADGIYPGGSHHSI